MEEKRDFNKKDFLKILLANTIDVISFAIILFGIYFLVKDNYKVDMSGLNLVEKYSELYFYNTIVTGVSIVVTLVLYLVLRFKFFKKKTFGSFLLKLDKKESILANILAKTILSFILTLAMFMYILSLF